MNKERLERLILSLEGLRDRTKENPVEINIDDVIRFLDVLINILKLCKQ